VPSFNTVVDTESTEYPGFPFKPDRHAGKTIGDFRHELVNAQVEVLRLYLEKQSGERLVEAVERLIVCAEASFRNEEALMECLTGCPDPQHRAAHKNVLAQLASLRACALNFDRGRFLARLILVDRTVTSHVAETLPTPEQLPRQDLANCVSAAHG
jgi:hemerythrin